MDEKKDNKYTTGISKAGQPPKFNNPDEMESIIDKYFSSLTPSEQELKFMELGMDVTIPKPTMTGLALFLGFSSRQSLYDYDSNPKFSYIIKRARLVIENHYENSLNSRSPTGAIFALKNMSWKDKTEVTNTNIDSTPLTPDEIKRARESLKDKENDF